MDAATRAVRLNPMRLLFICTQNLLRSPTAERIFSGRPGLDVASAGMAQDAMKVVSAEAIEWAEMIFVMEEWHRELLRRQFRRHLERKRLICLGIPDRYQYMDPQLVELLELKVAPYLSKGVKV